MLISKIYLPKSKYAYLKNIFTKIQICLSQKYIYQNPNMLIPKIYLPKSKYAIPKNYQVSFLPQV